MLLLKGCVDMSNSFDSSIRKIRRSRTERDGNLQIINEKHDSIFYKAIDPNASIEANLKSFDLPEDYVKFLHEFDSAILFRTFRQGGGCSILSPQRVISHWKGYSIDHPYYPIAWSDYSNGCVCVDQDRIDSGNGYLTWIESMDPDNPIDIDLTFTEWLDKLIEHEGKEFWIPPYKE